MPRPRTEVGGPGRTLSTNVGSFWPLRSPEALGRQALALGPESGFRRPTIRHSPYWIAKGTGVWYKLGLRAAVSGGRTYLSAGISVPQPTRG